MLSTDKVTILDAIWDLPGFWPIKNLFSRNWPAEILLFVWQSLYAKRCLATQNCHSRIALTVLLFLLYHGSNLSHTHVLTLPMPAHALRRGALNAGPGTPNRAHNFARRRKIWHDRFSKANGAMACPKCIKAAVDKDHILTCGAHSVTPCSNMPLMVTCNPCKKATRSVKLVKIPITTAEAKWQNTSLPTPSDTLAAMQ